jgi:hypothetical protein
MQMTLFMGKDFSETTLPICHCFCANRFPPFSLSLSLFLVPGLSFKLHRARKELKIIEMFFIGKMNA